MSGLISKQAAIYAIEKRMDDITDESFCEGMAEAIVEINLLPTADVEERKTGHWIDCGLIEEGRIYSCQYCLKSYVSKDRKMWANFCPNCGADMRGEVND